MPRKPSKPGKAEGALKFAELVEAVRQIHEKSAAVASRAVNLSLTLRNWLRIGNQRLPNSGILP